MKNTHTHIFRNIALSLLVVVTLVGFTNVFSANTTYAQAAAAPAVKTPAEIEADSKKAEEEANAKAAEDTKKHADISQKINDAQEKFDKTKTEIANTLEAEKAAAQVEFEAVPATADAAVKTAAKAKLDAAKAAAQAKAEVAVKAATAEYAKVVAVTPSASAAPGSTIGSQSVGSVLPPNDIIVMLSKVLSIILSMISQLLWPLLMFAGGLMKSDFLYTGAIDLKLSEMWIQVRNLVNIAYVLLLLAVALYNVVGLGETVSMLELKKALPKIILGLVLVNFSYAGVKVVLDVINVGTTFAFSIGQTDARLTQATILEIQKAQGPICDTIGGGGDLAKNIGKDASESAQKSREEKKVADLAACKKDAKCKETVNKNYDVAGKPKPGNANSEAMCSPDKNGKLVINDKVQRYLKSWNVDSSLMIIAIKFMNIQDLPKVSAAAAKGGIASLTINMLFSLVMFLIYAVSFIVLVVVLFARAAVLWMIIIFSPVIVLNATFPIPGVGGNSSKIVKTLIAPMLIGFILSIGFILLATMQNINYNGQGTLSSGAPTSSIDTFQDLLVAIGSVVFLWFGIKTATENTISDKITGPILEGAQTAGTWLAKAPFKYTPLFQVATPHAGHAGLQEAGKIGVDLIPQMFHELAQESDTKRLQTMRSVMGIGQSARPFNESKDPDTLRALIGERRLSARHYIDNEKSQKELLDAVRNIGKNHPEYLSGPKLDTKFKELYEEVKDGKKPSPKRMEEFIGSATEPAKPAAATPKNATISAIISTHQAKPEVKGIKAKLEAPTPLPLDDSEVGRAIAALSKELEEKGKITDPAERVRQFMDLIESNTKEGVWSPDVRNKIIVAAKTPVALAAMKAIVTKPGEAEKLQAEIK